MSPSPRYRRPGLPPLPAGFAARHAHDFLGNHHQRNARRVGGVMVLTLAMMVGEILAGTWFGSMALLADGWHMATHAGAMLITVLAYRYAQRAAGEARHSFGAGKVGDLAGFASALILIGVALIMAWESVARLLAPTPIEYGEAIAVAALGLAVNLASAWLLRDDHAHHHHGHDHGHSHAGHHHHDHHDHNLRAAYLHVLADALTSVLAIVALLLGQRYGWGWLDPVMGLVGAVVIVRWGRGLLHSTADVLLDAAPSGMTEAITQALGDDVGVLDLHVWQIGPGQHAAIVALSAARPASPAAYKARLTGVAGLAHVNVEVHAA
ncbi:CDF family Co(II)/Ni(II) efflux transporter DmeF [Rivihabitans pingtungensis]|uniref:CDF family Co(II)/Ni(II) efflux transporter DmeF n=1 Tax=Rivihabitans pingtungensis TaxID=1054498 RepID=UPI002FDA8B6D